MRIFRMIIWGLVLVATAFLIYKQMTPQSQIQPREDLKTFSLTNHLGERVTHETYAGKYMLIFFGYSYCPDVCPTELAKMSAALDILSDRGANTDLLQPIFITVDPERDTVEQMNDYVGLFHEKLVGLTGTAKEIATVAKTFQIYYKKQEVEGDPEGYLMDHMSLTFLMDKKGNRVYMFPATTTAEELAKALEPLTEE